MAKKPYEYDVEDEIQDVSVGRPHLVILGAGTSIAACPDGDVHRKRLPSMLNLVEIVGLKDILQAAALPTGGNFEDIYSSIATDSKFDVTRLALESAVHHYFSDLSLPESPTIYDHLVLSLRKKDTIATFNWDPFLVQALIRNRDKAPMPRTLFLHGNVAISLCLGDKRAFYSSKICPTCEKPTVPTRLLYPVSNKNYKADPFISAQWSLLEKTLQDAYLLTIFGYGAPKSDVEAIRLMTSAWKNTAKGDPISRKYEQTEIINILPEADLTETWDPFIHSHHYRISNNFYDSWLAKHPRRSCEAEWQQSMEAKFVDVNPIPTDISFEDLWKWLSTLISYE